MSPEFMELISNLVPAIIVVGLVIFFLRRGGGGQSFQDHCRQQMTAQTEAQMEIARNLDRIATALEQRQP